MTEELEALRNSSLGARATVRLSFHMSEGFLFEKTTVLAVSAAAIICL